MRWKAGQEGAGEKIVQTALESLKLREDGIIEFKFLAKFEAQLSKLDYFIEDNDVYAHHRKLSFLREALYQILKSGFGCSEFLAQVRALEEDYSKLPKKKFYVGSSVSITGHNLPGSFGIKIDGQFIRLSAQYPRKFQRREFSLDGFDRVSSTPESTYAVIFGAVYARDESEAGELGVDRIETFRALLNWYFNRRTVSLTQAGRMRAYNEILLGQFQFVFSDRGVLATDHVWYQPDFVRKEFCKSVYQEFAQLKAESQRVAALIDCHSFKEKMKLAFRKYGKALDEKDRHIGLMRLWGMLEMLTGVPDGESRIVARRLAFLFTDVDEAKEKIAHLAKIRNRVVHADREHSDIDVNFETVRFYSQKILNFLVENHFKFSSLHEFAEFADLPTRKSELMRRKELLEKAISFRKE